MQDPWKYIAFPFAAVAGYFASIGITATVANSTGLDDFAAQILVLAGAGFLAGFLLDEVIPAYIEKVRGASGSGGMGGSDDFGGGGDDDFGGGDLDFD